VARPFRTIDTGIRAGARNIAFDAALIELHQEGAVPDTLRFIQFPPTVLVGRHQALAREVRVDHCRTNGIGLARRITGGGAIYMDEGQFGFELVFDKSTLGLSSLGELTQALCEGVAAGLGKLGVAAKFRPRNDIEVDGRKISGTGGFIDGNTVIFQGTILVEMDPAKMLDVLNVPREKLAKRALDSAAQRVVTLTELLPELPPLADIKQALADGFCDRLGIAAEWGAITGEEEALAARHYDEEIGTADFLHSIDDPESGRGVQTGRHMGAGGAVTAHVRLEGATLDRFREVLITGDFFVTPPRVIFDLESHLRGTPVAEVRKTVEDFFGRAGVGLLSAQPADFAAAIENALAAPAERAKAPA
jgi:lipoate-protein ligase A